MDRKQIYLAPEATIFSFVPGEKLSAISEHSDDPWITNEPGNLDWDITSDRIDIDTDVSFGPED